jgi:hypothetical protein
MWKAPTSILCGCLAALPLLGCAGDVATAPQAATVAPVAVAENAPHYNARPRIYQASSAAPTAVLVFLPEMGPVRSYDFLARDPRLWAAEGFDVVMPQPADIYRLVADQEAAIARLIASAHALADAPIWLVGSDPSINAALAATPQLGRGQVSGVVVTAVTSNSGSCSESFFYADPGTGAPPKVEVKRSGDCRGIAPAGATRQPYAIPEARPARPNAPRIIEASAAPKGVPPVAQVQRLAELIKAAPSS